MVQRSHLRSW